MGPQAVVHCQWQHGGGSSMSLVVSLGLQAQWRGLLARRAGGRRTAVARHALSTAMAVDPSPGRTLEAITGKALAELLHSTQPAQVCLGTH